jgi:ATP-dependent DNA ligase
MVGAGLSEPAIDELLEAIGERRADDARIAVRRRDRRLSAARVVWCEPTLRCRVEFAEWTNDLRLRAPVFKGLLRRGAVAALPDPTL